MVLTATYTGCRKPLDSDRRAPSDQNDGIFIEQDLGVEQVAARKLVWINDEPVCILQAWPPPRDVFEGYPLKSGKNRIRVALLPEWGGIAARLDAIKASVINDGRVRSELVFSEAGGSLSSEANLERCTASPVVPGQMPAALAEQLKSWLLRYLDKMESRDVAGVKRMLGVDNDRGEEQPSPWVKIPVRNRVRNISEIESACGISMVLLFAKASTKQGFGSQLCEGENKEGGWNLSAFSFIFSKSDQCFMRNHQRYYPIILDSK